LSSARVAFAVGVSRLFMRKIPWGFKLAKSGAGDKFIHAGRFTRGAIDYG